MNAVTPDSLFGRVGGAYCAAVRQIDRLQPLVANRVDDLVLRMPVSPVNGKRWGADRLHESLIGTHAVLHCVIG